MYTFSGISLLKPEIFRFHNDQRFSLAKLLRRYVQKGAISGELHSGKWLDVGTIERLNKAKELIQG
jgi:MurNAc alpha-1-phosphate uridylyltransferase